MPKKNLLKIPQSIIDRIKTFELDDVIAACAMRVSIATIGRYAHLGLKYDAGNLVLPEPAIPKPSAGRYSLINVEGKEVIRRDLPMVTKTYSWDTPNWGDSYNGYHTVYIDREVYQRDFIPPKGVALTVELAEKLANNEFLVKFSIDEVINRRSDDFENELLFNLNILQENVGAADVFPSAATLAEYAATIHVEWELLPPGDVDAVMRHLLKGKRSIPPDEQKTMVKRLSVMQELKPENFVAGTSGFTRYFGAKFGDDFVAFENLKYGNALYVMYERWQELSRKSRIDLLKGPRDGFERIEHRDGWEKHLDELLVKHRARKKK